MATINRRTARNTVGATGGILGSHVAGQWLGDAFDIRDATGRGVAGGVAVGVPALFVADTMDAGTERDAVRHAGYASLGYAAANAIMDFFGQAPRARVSR